MLTGETHIGQHQHIEVVEALEQIVEAIRSGEIIPKPPVVNVTVDPTPINLSSPKVVLEDRNPVSYRFTIERDTYGRIERIIAEPT